jgi:hypothetical protein
MRWAKIIAAGIAITALCCFPMSETTSAQTDAQTEPLTTAPPKILLLVKQEVMPGKEPLREKLEVETARSFDRMKIPVSWIDMQSITGSPRTLFFDPLDSFEELDRDFDLFRDIYAAHPDLVTLRQQIQSLVAKEKTMIAVRRDDLGYRAKSIDLSKARYMRVLEVRLNAGRENDFVTAFQILGAAYEKINSDTPWVVYQINVGEESPTFLAFVPMRELRQNDDLLSRGSKLRAAEGEDGAQRMQQIARDAYARTESNLYVLRPEMSHVPEAFAAGDADFWTPSRHSRVEKPSDNSGDGPRAAGADAGIAERK